MPEAISMTPNNPIETILNLFRHLNPSQIETNLNLINEAFPEYKETLGSVVDVPSSIIIASESNNREYLSYSMTKNTECSKCYRCPWDNKMYTLDGNLCCSDNQQESKPEELVELEVALNEAVRTYASLYYGSEAITSVYIIGTSYEEFSVAIFIKKRAELENEENNSSSKATWDSNHLFEIEATKDANYIYRHTATVMLSFDNSVENLKNIQLNGNIIRQNESQFPYTSTANHLVNIGGILEECEIRLRNDLQMVYFGRTHDTVNELRSAMPEGFLRNQTDFRDEMLAKLKNRG